MIVLLLNDHVLKQTWPGLVTGKLSDVAGLVVAPPLVALLLARRADLAATLLTGALFTLVKTTQTGAEAATLIWTTLAGPSRVLADPGDLVALPALLLAWWVRQRSREAVAARRRVLTAVPLAVLAVTATSAVPARPSAGVVALKDGAIVLDGAYESRDGGTSWVPYVPPRPARITGVEEPVVRSGPGQRAACLREHCYRLVDGRVRVMRSADAGRTWALDWEIPPGRVTMLERELSRERPGEEPIVASSLVVQERPGGHVVVVANRRDGVAVRAVDGMWRRIGFTGDGRLLESAAIPLRRPADDGGEMLVAGMAAAWAALLALSVQAGRRARVRAWLTAVLGGLGGLLTALIPFGGAFGWQQDPPWTWDPTPLLSGALGTVLLISAAFVASSLVADGAIRSRGAVDALALGVLAGLCVAAPFRAWSVGLLDHGVALALAAVVAPVVTVAGLVALRRRGYLTGSSTSSPT
ncbi:hypothetical protein OUY22_35060 [Nonomuraea sp. MCN248]|uniref:Uncharacterized protein n=1 Tax=Nonomuraea corallina TaxID=2989783 RepID=A0ABT4SNT6_9ACTN|nr:hypothetical protein [Nonomuraea corallina]MDA0638658.1 hypothetical protein [Nonomuraea corallina]